MRQLILLIGLPASGKSFWTANFLKKNPDFQVVSSDDIIDQECQKVGLTYNEGFQKFIGYASKEFDRRFREGIEQGQSLIVDRTNMNQKSRKKFLKAASEAGYEKIAVNFQIPDTVRKNRMKVRFEKTGKSIPDHVIDSMASGYQAPSKEEGFDKIILVKD